MGWKIVDLSDHAHSDGIRALSDAIQKLNASPADYVGLWSVPGYPDLTAVQLIELANQEANSPDCIRQSKN